MVELCQWRFWNKDEFIWAAVFCCRVSCDLPQGKCLYSPDCLIAALVFDSLGLAVSLGYLIPAVVSSGRDIFSAACWCQGLGELRFEVKSALAGVLYLCCLCTPHFPDQNTGSQANSYKAVFFFFFSFLEVLLQCFQRDLQPMANCFPVILGALRECLVLCSLTYCQACPVFSASCDPTCCDDVPVPWETLRGHSVPITHQPWYLRLVPTGGGLGRRRLLFPHNAGAHWGGGLSRGHIFCHHKCWCPHCECVTLSETLLSD